MIFLLFILLIFLTLSIFYLYVLFFVGYLFKSKAPKLKNPEYSFAVIVPAHNEEKLISQTIKSIKGVDYPSELFEIIVIADNCSDNTAEIVASMGVRCIERNEPIQPGKGRALQYALHILLKENFQAIAVVDADTIIDANFLDVMNTRLASGVKVLQSRYGVLNPDESALTYMFAVGNTIENDLLLLGRDKIGLPSILRGNGMCFNVEVLRNNPWESLSIVEDTEFSTKLLLNGVKTFLVPETGVLSRMPRRISEAFSQRVRWVSGNSRFAKFEIFVLLAEGIRVKRFDLLEMVWCFFIRSKPLLIILSALLITLCLFSQAFISWGFILLAFLFLYIVLGMIFMGLSLRRLKLALFAPFFLSWLVVVYFIGLVGFRSKVWSRTPRP